MTKYLNETNLETWSRAAYAKSNFSVVANGASHSELAKRVGEFFAESTSSPPAKIPEISTAPSKYYGGEERIAHDSGNNMIIAFPGSGSFTGGAYKPELSVLAALLGGTSSIKWSTGFSLLSRATASHPHARLRTEHSTYSDVGLLYVSIAGNAAHVRSASAKVVKTIKDIASGSINKEDVQKAVASAKFRALEAGQNIGAGLELTGAGLVHGGKAFQIDDVGKSIEKVTDDQVKKVNSQSLSTPLADF